MLSDFIVEKNNSLPKDENEITSIAINYRSIKIVDYLPYTFTKITELYLNHNLIVSVVGLKQFKFLNVCELKFNYIEKMNEFEHLKELKKLERLNLTGNPIEKSEKFSFHFFKSIFPKLQKLNGSDDIAMSSKINNTNDFPTQVTATFAKSQNILCEDKRLRVLSNSMFLGDNKGLLNRMKEKNLKTQEVFNDVSFDINYNFENKENLFFTKNNFEKNHFVKNIENIDEDLDDLAEIFYTKALYGKVIKSLKTNVVFMREITSFRNLTILIKILNFLKIYAYSKRVTKMQFQKIHRMKKDLNKKLKEYKELSEYKNSDSKNLNQESMNGSKTESRGSVKYFSSLRRVTKNGNYEKLILNEDSLKL